MSDSALKVIVAGGRYFSDKQAVFCALDELRGIYGELVIIQGGCNSGADSFARGWVDRCNSVPGVSRGVSGKSFAADWAKHGNAAGPIRNQRMIDEGSPDLVVLFPGGKGTENMRKLAEKAGIPIWEPMEDE